MWKKIKKAGLLLRHMTGYNPRHHAWHDYHYKYLKVKEDLGLLTDISLYEARILVYGCGYHYPEVALFSIESGHVKGIDTSGAFHRDRLSAISADLKRTDGSNPFLAILKAWIKKNYYYRRYFRQLKKTARFEIKHDRYSLTSYDGKRLPYEDNTFDLVISNSVLEHVEDLKNGLREIHRVTRPGGISYHVWHNFYSFSGGHAPVSVTNRHPWGHILGKYETPYLNRLTPDDIKACMNPYFNVTALYGIDRQYRKQGIDPEFEYEQEHLLTDELLGQLPDLPREWFLTTAYLIVGRKE